MTAGQLYFLVIFGIFNLSLSFVGIHKYRGNRVPKEYTYPLYPIGIFMWADAIIFGMFWFLVSTTVIIMGDWILFLLVFAVFWVVRSLGETIYFFNQQFSSYIRAPVEDIFFHRLFGNAYVTWFVAQIFMQCVTVVSIISSVYLFKLWL